MVLAPVLVAALTVGSILLPSVLAQQELQCEAEVRSRGTGWTHEKCQSHCADGDCPPLHCICGLNPNSGEVVEAPVGTAKDSPRERCWQFHASDDDVHLFVMMNATHGALTARLRTGTGPEGHRMRPSKHEYDLEVKQGTIARLSRDEWRETAAKDEGEWVGDWTICIEGTGEMALVVMVTPCLVDSQGEECSGRGSCLDEMVQEGCSGTMTTCRRDYCSCNGGWGGDDCGAWVGFPPPPAVVMAPDVPPPPPLPPPNPPQSPFPVGRPASPPPPRDDGGDGLAPGGGGLAPGGGSVPAPEGPNGDGGDGGGGEEGGGGGGGRDPEEDGGGVRPGDGKIVHPTAPPSSGWMTQVGFWLGVVLLTCCGWAGIQYYFHVANVTSGGGGGDAPPGLPFPFGNTVVMGVPMKGPLRKWGKSLGAKYTEMTPMGSNV